MYHFRYYSIDIPRCSRKKHIEHKWKQAQKQPHEGLYIVATCNAKTRSGTPCQKSAMENGRCALHGGKSTGAPKGNNNAMTHGIYSSVLNDEEKELFGNGKLRDLLSMAYIQHLRAIKTDQPEIAERLLGRISTIEKTLCDSRLSVEQEEMETDGFEEMIQHAIKTTWTD